MELSNPVADLISVPFQFNFDRNIGLDRRHSLTLNIQPVVPFDLNSDWNLITRTILPVISQDERSSRRRRQSGIGDILQSFFLSPKEPTTAGSGRRSRAPLADRFRRRAGSHKYGVGPTGVVLKQKAAGLGAPSPTTSGRLRGTAAAPTSARRSCNRSSPTRPRQRRRSC